MMPHFLNIEKLLQISYYSREINNNQQLNILFESYLKVAHPSVTLS